MKTVLRSFTNIFWLQLIFSFLMFELGLTQVPLDLEEALRLAKQNNLKLQQQKESEKVAALEELVQKANLRPSLDLSLSTDYLSEINQIDLSQTIGVPDRRIALGGHDRSEVMLSIQQPLFTGFRLQSHVDLAKNSTLSEQAKFDILANKLYHQVHLIFYQFQSLAKQRRILGESLKRLNIQLQHVRNLFKADQIMAFDTLQVYNQALTVRIELQDIELASRLATLQMVRILDLRETQPIQEVEVESPTGGNNHIFDLNQLKSQALEKRPELKSILLAKNSANIQQKIQRSNYFPSIYARANLHYAKPG
ncbi:TolC family protein, partial [bacterium]|nr:TolC family protein [bacterium]